MIMDEDEYIKNCFKYCYKCKKYLLKDEFRKNKSKKDGLCSECKQCQIMNRRLQRHKDLTRDAAHSKLRRERVKSAKGVMPTLEELKEIQGNCCLACGSTENLRRDHVIPVTKGGTNDISNIQLLCDPCNTSKGNRIIDYRSAVEPI